MVSPVSASTTRLCEPLEPRPRFLVEHTGDLLAELSGNELYQFAEPFPNRRLHPAGIVLAGLLLALLAIAGDYAQMMLGMPSSIGGLFQGTLLFFLLGADVLTTWRLRWTDAAPAPPDAPTSAETA